MLQRCSDVIVAHWEVAFARIWTLNATTQTLELQASAGCYTHLNGPHSRVKVGQYKIGWIAEEKKPLLTNSVQSDLRERPGMGQARKNGCLRRLSAVDRRPGPRCPGDVCSPSPSRRPSRDHG